MKRLFLLIALFNNLNFAQTITGKVVNNLFQGLEGKKVEVHLSIDGVYNKLSDWTDALGNFSADSASTVDVKDDNYLPDGYEVSNNFPQPFNPKTIFNVTLPSNAQVSVEVFTILGQRILTLDKKEYPSGLNRLVIELNGFSNGVYIARINIDDKYIVTRKMLLLYGSQHAQDFSNVIIPDLKKQLSTIILDSITITGNGIWKKTFHYGVQIISGNYDVGNIPVDLHLVNITIDVKKLMEWKQATNQFANAKVKLDTDSAFTDTQGLVSFVNVPSGRIALVIDHPQIYKREAILNLEHDSTHTEYIIDTLNFPQAVMNFYNPLVGRIPPSLQGEKTNRWTEPPIFYIVADTTQEPGRWRAQQQIAKIDTVLKPAYTTPKYPEGFLKDAQIQIGTTPPTDWTGYYVIDWADIAPYVGLTYVGSDTATGEIKSAYTTYHKLLTHYEMDYLTIHELSSGMSFAGRSNDIPSVWNLPLPPYEYRNFAPTDLQIILYQYTRPPGNKIVDKDNDF